MADESAQSKESPKKQKKGLPKTLVIILAVAAVEGAIFFGAVKLFGGGPQTSYGAEGEHVLKGEETDPDAGTVEVAILSRFKVPNSKMGRAFIYDFDVSAVVSSSRLPDMEKLVKERSGEISDRLAQIIRAANPRDLEEPNLETIRLKFKTAMGEIAKDEKLVQRVLIPRWVPMQAG